MTKEPQPATLKPADLVNGDPVLKLLASTRISPILLGVAYVLAFFAIRGFFIWRAGHLRTAGTVTGFFDDPALYSNFVAGAIVWAFYVWMPRGVAGVFNGLHENKVIGKPIPSETTQEQKKESLVNRVRSWLRKNVLDRLAKPAPLETSEERTYESFINEVQFWFGRWWWPVGLLAISVVVVVVLVLPQYLEMASSSCWDADPISLVLSLLWMLANLYCVLIVLIYSVLTIYWLHRLFNSFDISVRPLHPDRAGGLAPLGNFTLMLSYLIAVVGVMFVLTSLTRNYVVKGTWDFRWTTELLVGLGVYAVASPITFFAPLLVARRAMKDAKDELLLKIARRFESEYEAVQDALVTPKRDAAQAEQSIKVPGGPVDRPNPPGSDAPGFERSLKTLKELQELHDMTNKFPVWPFNLSNLTRFSTTYLLPVLLPLAIEWLSRLLNP